MKLISSKDELIENLKTFNDYLLKDRTEEKDFVHELIKRGKCFVLYEDNGDLRFAPSRFLGYVDNTKSKHEENKHKKAVDGKDTNPQIRMILGCPAIECADTEKKFLAFCHSLGLDPNNQDRSYWINCAPINLNGV